MAPLAFVRVWHWAAVLPVIGAAGLSPGSARNPAGIPRQVFATVPSSTDPAHVDELRHNLEEMAGISPEQVRVLNDEEMDASAYAISGELEQVGLNGSYEAFTLLRPGAFKADLWRYMQLWSEGGIYVDDSIRLKKPLDSWLDFKHDRFVLVQDVTHKSYWNAMMAVEPRLPELLHMIAAVVQHVEQRYYGNHDLEVTGPMALYEQVQKWAEPGVAQVKLKLELQSDNCGTYPAPPCEVGVVDLSSKEVVAYKDSNAHRALHGAVHYSRLWQQHEVYCDEPSDVPCQQGRPRAPLPVENPIRLRHPGRRHAPISIGF